MKGITRKKLKDCYWLEIDLKVVFAENNFDAVSVNYDNYRTTLTIHKRD